MKRVPLTIISSLLCAFSFVDSFVIPKGVQQVGIVSRNNDVRTTTTSTTQRKIQKFQLNLQQDEPKNGEQQQLPIHNKNQPSKSNQTSTLISNLEPIWTKIQTIFKTIYTNTFSKDKDFGSRGEIIVMIQFILMTLILLGKVPLLQHLINFIFGPVLFLCGIGMTTLAIKELNTTSFTALTHPVPKQKGGKMITTGIYSYMRHPVYTGNMACLIGLSLMTQSSMRLFLSMIYLFVVDRKSNEEERNMEREFGVGVYQRYREEVRGKFIPHWDVIAAKLAQVTNNNHDDDVVLNSSKKNGDEGGKGNNDTDGPKSYLFP